MKRKVTVVLLALVAALLLGLSVFFVACDVGTESGGQNTEQGGTDEEQGDGNEGETGGETGEEGGETGGENEGETGGEIGEEDGEGETGEGDPAPVPDVSDKFVFTLNDERTAYSVTDMDASAEGSVTIPASYNGLPVTSIGSRAFWYCSGLTEITIPEGVTSIGSRAFYNCSGLTEITIPAGVTSIGSYAFYNCSGLTEITIPDGVTSIGSDVFRDCSGLTEINYNAVAVADLASGSNVFRGAGSNSGGIAVTFGESVTRIPAYLFWYANITSVTIGSNVESIGSSAFNGCSSLASVTIGEGVTSIGDDAFWLCSGLTEINYNAAAVADLTNTSNVFYNAGSNSEGITVIFGESVTSIPAYLFYFVNITSVTIGSNVESIGEDVFYGCSSLTGVYINDLAAWCTISFGNSTANPLYNAEDLYLNGELVTELVIPDGVTSIGSYAFYDCSGLMEITLPDSVTSIGSSAFYNCYKLIEVYNQSALDIVAGSRDNGYVAYYAKNVYTQEVGKSWFTDTEEGYRFFYDGSKGYLMEYNGTETELILPAAFTAYNGTEVTEYEIYKYAFYERKDLITVTIPDSVTSIGSSAFDDCSGLTEITIPEGVTSIGSRAFYNCSGLTEITIPEGVTSIGSRAFYNCSGLTEITIPAGVTSIGSYAFYNCSGLTEINYNAAAVADCGDLVFCDAGSNPEGCTIIFGESVTSIPADLFARGASAYVSNFVSVTIGSNVKSIGSSAFDGCSSLTSVTIGEGVTSIGSSAFRDCSGLTEITIPDSVMSIGLSTFYGCSSLTSVTIGEGVTSIGLYAFRHCSGLTEITIPAGVTSIGSSAFEGCSKLTSVTFENTEGWWYASSSGATSGTEIASSDLADPSTAATYLKSRYYNYYWYRA